MTGEPIRAVDLFCGAGGLSHGLALASEELDRDVELHAVNHWTKAIETHEKNHPWAEHYHAKVEELHPPDVVNGKHVDILVAAPECTHFSTARGGKPVDEQLRASPWHVLDWLEKLPSVDNILLENVPEFASWGPVDEEGKPSRNGEIFDAWKKSLHALGYSVRHRVLNAADYGDATTRRRLFVIGRRHYQADFPTPTHAENAGNNGKKPWRTAAEIIDWTDPGESIWTRSRPLVQNTMRRIAEGIRRYGHRELEPFADAVASLDKQDVEAMQKEAVPVEEVQDAVEIRGDPFLVKFYGTSTAKPVGNPLDTVTAGGQKFALCVPYLLGQQSQAAPRAATQHPVSTIATRGAISLISPRGFVLPRNGVRGGLHSNAPYDPYTRPLHTVTAKNHDGHLVRPSLIRFSHGGALLNIHKPVPTITTARCGDFALSTPRLSYLVPFYGERAGQTPRTHGLDAPLPTVPASKSPAGVASPYLIQYNNGSGARPLTDPMPTATTRDRFALVLPELYPWGIDIRFRMLQPRELAAAMGFPPSYEFAGNKTETIEQIGNAVPVNLAKSLILQMLTGKQPTITEVQA